MNPISANLNFLSPVTYSEEFSTQKIGGGYYKFRINGSEGINKIFGVGIFDNSSAANFGGNCIELVVSQFLLVNGNIIATYQ